MPIFLLADGYNDTSVWYYPPLFTLSLMIISSVWTWMRLKSGSVWPGVVCHAATIRSFSNSLIRLWWTTAKADMWQANLVPHCS